VTKWLQFGDNAGAGSTLHKKNQFREKNLLKMMGQNRLTNFRKYGIMEVLAASAAGSPVKSPYRIARAISPYR